MQELFYIDSISENVSPTGDMLENSAKINCPQCNVSFVSTNELKIHVNSQHIYKRYKCSTCNASFKQNIHLTIHTRKHTGERPYKCDICISRFTQLSHLKTHIKTHTGEKPFKCEYCEARFRQSANLKSHVLTHTGERPYKCSMCESDFVQKGHLQNHIRIHNGEKPFKCTRCQSSFRQVSNLYAHLKGCHTDNSGEIVAKVKRRCKRRKTRIKPRIIVTTHQPNPEEPSGNYMQNWSPHEITYQCSYCDKFFVSTKKMKAHMDVHFNSGLCKQYTTVHKSNTTFIELKKGDPHFSVCVDQSIINISAPDM